MNINHFIKRRGLTKKQAARILNVSERTVHNYCNDPMSITLAQAKLLKDYSEGEE